MIKKYLLAAVLAIGVLALVGCSETSSDDKKETNVIKEDESKEDESKEDESKEGDSSNASGLADVIKKIYEIKKPEFMVMEQNVDLSNKDVVKSFIGLEDTSKIKEILASDAMMSSQAYSLVLVKANDKEDVKDIANEMLEKVDKRKWICVEADDLQIVTADDTIMLIMLSTGFEESITSDDLVNAFKDVVGKDLDIKLTK